MRLSAEKMQLVRKSKGCDGRNTTCCLSLTNDHFSLLASKMSKASSTRFVEFESLSNSYNGKSCI